MMRGILALIFLVTFLACSQSERDMDASQGTTRSRAGEARTHTQDQRTNYDAATPRDVPAGGPVSPSPADGLTPAVAPGVRPGGDHETPAVTQTSRPPGLVTGDKDTGAPQQSR